LHHHTLKVLEIDARLPSQTPTVVYWSTGLNMVEAIADFILHGMETSPPDLKRPKGVIYEHISVSPQILAVAGEHIMSGSDPLSVQRDFFGADEAITNYSPGRTKWVATLIFSAARRESAWEKRDRTIMALRKKFKLERYRDHSPNPDSPKAKNSKKTDCL
jgi:pyrrolysine biosynthesis protein PylC